MVQDGLDNLLILDETDDPHGPPAFWANQGINLVDFLNQPGPAFQACRRGPVGFDDAGDDVRHIFLLPFSPQDVAVPAVVPDHLLSAVRDMRTHGGEPFLGVEDLPFYMSRGMLHRP